MTKLMDDKKNVDFGEELPIVDKTEFEADEFPDEIGNKFADVVKTENKEKSDE